MRPIMRRDNKHTRVWYHIIRARWKLRYAIFPVQRNALQQQKDMNARKMDKKYKKILKMAIFITSQCIYSKTNSWEKKKKYVSTHYYRPESPAELPKSD